MCMLWIVCLLVTGLTWLSLCCLSICFIQISILLDGERQWGAVVMSHALEPACRHLNTDRCTPSDKLHTLGSFSSVIQLLGGARYAKCQNNPSECRKHSLNTVHDMVDRDSVVWWWRIRTGSQATWSWILTVPLTNCKISGKTHNIFVSQFPNLHKKCMIKSTSLVGLWGLKQTPMCLFISSFLHSFNIQCSIKLALFFSTTPTFSIPRLPVTHPFFTLASTALSLPTQLRLPSHLPASWNYNDSQIAWI